MKVTCPNNPEHDVFEVDVIVRETWITAEDGYPDDCASRENLKMAEDSDVWICCQCKCLAQIER